MLKAAARGRVIPIPVPQASAPVQSVVHVENGTLEALKWLALVLMTGDHVNKYLLHDGRPWLFRLGRLVMPLFGFVLAYNLARPGAAARGVYLRVGKRLALFGLISTPAFLALGGLLYRWWPLNIMFTLLATTACAYLFFERPGWQAKLLGVVVLVVGGSSVEFWWPAVLMNLALVAWVKSGRRRWIVAAFVAAFFLGAVNGDQWALASFPIILASPMIHLQLHRVRWAFYVYYPALLYLLLAARMIA